MKYLFFDIECCDGHTICSFGYVVTDENFNILVKKDIIINPEKKFNLCSSDGSPRIQLAYPKKTFFNALPFSYHYDEIKNLLEDKDQVIVGHSIDGDIIYLRNACEKYNKEILNFYVYDTQDIYFEYTKTNKSIGLEKMADALNVDKSNLTLHKSCDDAELTMRVVKDICEKMECNLSELIDLCKKNSHKGTDISTKILVTKLKKKYLGCENWKKIAFSDSYNFENENLKQNIIKNIFKKKFYYTDSVSECDYYLYGDGTGKRDYSFEYNTNNLNKKITKIDFSGLLKLLKLTINDDGKLENEIDENNPIALALKKAKNEKNKK